MSHDENAHLPTPSIWPATLALGLSMAFFGIISSALFVVTGALLMVAGVVGWIGELRHE